MAIQDIQQLFEHAVLKADRVVSQLSHDWVFILCALIFVAYCTVPHNFDLNVYEAPDSVSEKACHYTLPSYNAYLVDPSAVTSESSSFARFFNTLAHFFNNSPLPQAESYQAAVSYKPVTRSVKLVKTKHRYPARARVFSKKLIGDIMAVIPEELEEIEN